MVSIVSFVDDESDESSTAAAAVDGDGPGNGKDVFHRRGLKLNDTKKESFFFSFVR